MNLRSWLVIAAMLAAGCPSDEPDETMGSEGSGGPVDPTEGEPLDEVPLAEFFARAEAAHCAWQVRCSGYGSAERCASVVHMDEGVAIGELAGVGSYDRVTPDYVAMAVEVGRIEYDEEAAATCLNFAAGRTCERARFHEWTEQELAGQAACLATFTGRMGKNGPCGTALECAEASICGFDPSCTDMCCPGACRVLAKPIPVGQPCGVNPNVACEDGAVCAFDPDTSTQLCAPLGEVGENCDFKPCDEASACEWDGESQSVCVARRGAGEACLYDECEPGLVCVRSQDFNSGECVRPVGAGEACVVAYAGEATCLRFDDYCDPVTRTCVTLPGKGEGCENSGCRGDLFCSQQLNYQCSPMADEGEPCDWNDFEYVPCSGDNRCEYDGNAARCVAPPGEQCPVPEDVQGG